MEENVIKKLTDDEIKELKSIITQYTEIELKIGRMTIDKILLTKQLSSIDDDINKAKEEYFSMVDKEKSFARMITEKYGKGSIDPETGLFTVIR